MIRFLLLLICIAIPAQVFALDFAGSGILRFAGNGVLRLAGIYTGPELLTGWINPVMTGLTTPSPYVVTDDRGYGDAWEIFDHNTSSSGNLGIAWITGYSWVKIDFGAGNPQLCNTLYVRNSNGYGPKDFNFDGSNNDSDWTLLGGGTFANVTATQTFTLSNTTPYRYYRLSWTTGYDTTSCFFYELMLYNVVE